MSDVVIDREFAGGNIVVEKMEGDTVQLRQERGECSEWWFYWQFRIRGCAGRRMRFVFSDGDVFTAMGPALCVVGRAWGWLGRERVERFGEAWGFEHEFGEVDEAYVCLSVPYVQRNLDTFLAEHPAIERSILCRSEEGREVELLTLAGKSGRYFVPRTARTHACEAMANFVIEGIFEHALSDEATGIFLREHVDLRAVPFVDKDGVEKGEQGKVRRPHDHNRDWTHRPIYASVRAIQEAVFGWRGEGVVSVDVHCPWIRNGQNETNVFVGSSAPMDVELRKLTDLLAATQTGELKFSAKSTFPFGKEWNSGNGPTCGRFMRENVVKGLGATLEGSYGLAGGKVVTAEGARGLGRDVGRALALYIMEWEKRKERKELPRSF